MRLFQLIGFFLCLVFSFVSINYNNLGAHSGSAAVGAVFVETEHNVFL